MADKLLSEKIRNILINQMKYLPENNVGLFLSGGIDSLAVLFALIEAGKTINCYTFSRSDYDSPDLIASRQICNKLDLQLTEIRLPVNLNRLKNDLLKLHNEFLCTKKNRI